MDRSWFNLNPGGFRETGKKKSNENNSLIDSLPFQALPSNCPFPATCLKCHHRHHHFSGCNQSTSKGKQ